VPSVCHGVEKDSVFIRHAPIKASRGRVGEKATHRGSF